MHIPAKIPVIGLVGGIGAGKSFLAQALAENQHIVMVNGDAAGHEVLKQEPTKARIRDRFGPGVFDAAGEVDRKALARAVFGSGPAESRARADLEQIVHPAIGRILSAAISAARADPDVTAIILDAAILLETGWRKMCDVVVFVDVPEGTRRERVAHNRGWSPAELRAREASQLPIEEKRQAADYVLDNSGDPEAAIARFQEIFRDIQARNAPPDTNRSGG